MSAVRRYAFSGKRFLLSFFRSASGYKFRLFQAFRSVSDTYTLRSVRRKKILSMSRDVSDLSCNLIFHRDKSICPLLIGVRWWRLHMVNMTTQFTAKNESESAEQGLSFIQGLSNLFIQKQKAGPVTTGAEFMFSFRLFHSIILLLYWAWVLEQQLQEPRKDFGELRGNF